MYKFGLIGYGKMGGSIIDGLVKSNTYAPKDILIYSLNSDDILSRGFNLAKDELDVFENSEVVLFAIKPQTFPEVIEKLNVAKNKPLVISIAAGITIDYIKNNLNGVKVIRFMPNLGAAISMAVSTMSHSDNATKDDIEIAKNIFSKIGSITEVDNEDDINTLLPLNGSYPAYIWYFIRSFVRYAKDCGVSEEAAREMLADATIGCAKMLKESPKDLDTLIKDVCSYKGTTIEGVNVFDEKDLDSIVKEASIKCANRGRELEIK